MSMQEAPELLRRNATCLIDVAAYSRFGLDAAAFDVAPGRRGLFGLRGVEGVGGKLVLTSRALWFHPHRLNFTRAEFGIPLDEITEVRDVSRGPSRRVEVVMRRGARPRFVVWGIPVLIAAIDRARGASSEQAGRLE